MSDARLGGAVGGVQQASRDQVLDVDDQRVAAQRVQAAVRAPVLRLGRHQRQHLPCLRTGGDGFLSGSHTRESFEAPAPTHIRAQKRTAAAAAAALRRLCSEATARQGSCSTPSELPLRPTEWDPCCTSDGTSVTHACCTSHGRCNVAGWRGSEGRRIVGSESCRLIVQHCNAEWSQRLPRRRWMRMRPPPEDQSTTDVKPQQ